MMKNNSPLVISVTGWSGSGKTTFCERLIAELNHRGLVTAAAKKTRRNVNPDREGSDSRRFSDAGAEAVCFGAADSFSVFYNRPLESDNDLASLFPDADIIIAEGFKPSGAVRIETAGPDKNKKTVTSDDDSEVLKNPLSELDILVYADTETLQAALIHSEVSASRPDSVQRDNISRAADLVMCRLKNKRNIQSPCD